ncbi:peptidoglycan recognition protein family protein [Neobacillus jeddahensis]|uniref:peptidoglycan recognition protein family protein n=1 Tax=Neobacillus jeddahensis TaxID=1461580 RepID=UPI0006937D95|nr:N-acetylmuramoyl-L-alanine amidase [Neobacillus jeddahensis]
MNIVQRFIPASNKDTRSGIKMVPKYITIHETDNPSPGADADAHARLQERGNDRTASWHLQIDDHEAIQSIPFDEVAWAAGDGENGPGNKLSIHIETCVNSDGDFKKAVQNTAEVTRQLMVQFNIPIANVVQHNHWSGKNCPRHLRAGDWGISWSDYIGMVQGIKVAQTPVQPVTKSSPSNLLKKGSTGEAVKKYQQDLIKAGEKLPRYGVDGDFGEETEVATKAFQARHGLSVDGIAGPETLAKLAEVLSSPATGASVVPYPGHSIKRGSKGTDVQRVQRAVGVTADGDFGPATERAVKAYQSRHGLAADGIVGPQTWSVMF